MPAPERASTVGPADQELAAVWERWWAGMGDAPGVIVWDASAGDLQADLPRFAAAFDPALPVIDIGCGNGRQTRFLAQHFPTVVGTDISPAAIAQARTVHAEPNVGYRVLNIRDPAAAARLHGEFGDANVYIRGVLQALPSPGRAPAVESIGLLLGRTGTLFAKELPPRDATYFQPLIQVHGLPRGLPKVMRHIPPGQISEQELVGLFPAERFEMTGTGASHMHTINTLPGGEVITVPAIWALLRPRRHQPISP
jgi:2-polyprenyl-3-methyl-5-hydroxy-6-metoxy-1,4-benzoquinol methylase